MAKMRHPALAVLANVALAYIAGMLSRAVYVLENWKHFSAGLRGIDWGLLLEGAFVFDSAQVVYANILYVALALLPWRAKERPGYYRALRWAYVAPNLLAVLLNAADSVYYPFSGKRTTCSVFSEFAHEDNAASIILTEAASHWYLALYVALMGWILAKAYRQPLPAGGMRRYYPAMAASMAVSLALCLLGMRGTCATDAPPRKLRDANLFVSRPSQAAIVLNTPFSLVRSVGNPGFSCPAYFGREYLDSHYSPIRVPADTIPFAPKNVAIIIVESLGSEYVGFFNRGEDSVSYCGYTPFLDSLFAESLTFKYSFANGRKSVDAMPSLLCSLPMMEASFFTSPYISNSVDGLPVRLAQKGYRTTFFHGASNGSMGFDSFAHALMYQDYYGRSEYCADPDFGGDADFDGCWAIWDGNFIKFWQKHLQEMEQPFLSTIFTATSHHPYNIPDGMRDDFPEGTLPIHKCIRYVDHCLKEFFDFAKSQKWYSNTIFVISGDHTNQTCLPEYQTDLGYFCTPVVFFDPSGTLPRGRVDGLAQQIDVMPTLLAAMHYDQPYLAFGKNLMDPQENWAFCFADGTYQYLKGDFLLQFDGKNPKALYNFRSDWMLSRNIVDSCRPLANSISDTLKLMVQSYMERMIGNRLAE